MGALSNPNPNMLLVHGLLLFLLANVPASVPPDPGLYLLQRNSFLEIEGHAVTIVGTKSKIPMKGKLPIPGGQVRGEILGEHAETAASSTPVFYYRLPSDEEAAGAADLVLVRLRVKRGKHGYRAFIMSSEGDWKSSSGIPLRSQVEVYARRIESGLFKLIPSVDLKPGEYGFYLFRGRNMPGILYDFSVKE